MTTARERLYRMVKRIIILIVSVVICSLNAYTQSFNTRWITTPKDWSGWQVWLNRTFKGHDKPLKGHVEIATTGRYDLYVNQYNVSSTVLMPYRERMDDASIATSCHDVTPLLNDTSNTIALWIAPVSDDIRTPLLSVCYYGTDAEGRPFAYYSDNSWMCRKANATNESIDATEYTPYWNADTMGVAMWRNAIGCSEPTGYPNAKSTLLCRKVTACHSPEWLTESRDTLTAGFNHPITGWPRITIRGARHGERISVNGLTYICDGTMDEQACRKFTVETADRITITGDRHFSPSQIQKIEFLEISTTSDL